MKTPCNYFTLLLTISHSSRSNSWRDIFMETRWWRSWWWRSWCHAGEEDDHGAPKMEIKGAIWYWPYNVTVFLIACDVYHVFASYLLRTTVVNKMIPSLNFKIKVFFLSMHHCDSSSCWTPRDDQAWYALRSHTTGARQFCTCGILGLNLTTLACTDMASEHWRPKGRTWII